MTASDPAAREGHDSRQGQPSSEDQGTATQDLGQQLSGLGLLHE